MRRSYASVQSTMEIEVVCIETGKIPNVDRVESGGRPVCPDGQVSSWRLVQPPATTKCRAARDTAQANQDPAILCPTPIEYIYPTHELVDIEAISAGIFAVVRLGICDRSMLSRLDSRSRAVLNGFARRLCLAVWLALLCCYIQQWSYQHALGLLQLMCTAAAFGAMVLALWKHEHLKSQMLTFWDERMVLNALSLPTHGLVRHKP
jgi:hypothetical protein